MLFEVSVTQKNSDGWTDARTDIWMVIFVSFPILETYLCVSNVTTMELTLD